MAQRQAAQSIAAPGRHDQRAGAQNQAVQGHIGALAADDRQSVWRASLTRKDQQRAGAVGGA